MSPPNLSCRSCSATGLQALRGLPHGPALSFCPACSLIQRTSPVSSTEEVLLASASLTKTRLAEKLAEQIIQARRLDDGSLVIEVGSNDGWLLRHYREAGIPVLGFDRQRDAARIARHRHGIPTREAAFNKRTADLLHAQGLRADVFHAHDVLNRTSDLVDFVSGVRRVLRDSGLAILEVPYVKDTLERGGHGGSAEGWLFYFSLTSLCYCLTGLGLLVHEVERTPTGTLRLQAMTARPGAWPGDSVAALLVEEETWNVRSVDTYAPLVRRARPMAA